MQNAGIHLFRIGGIKGYPHYRMPETVKHSKAVFRLSAEIYTLPVPASICASYILVLWNIFVYVGCGSIDLSIGVFYDPVNGILCECSE